MKHSYAKLKKLIAETNTELSHALRRAEQYEAEVIFFFFLSMFCFSKSPSFIFFD